MKAFNYRIKRKTTRLNQDSILMSITFCILYLTSSLIQPIAFYINRTFRYNIFPLYLKFGYSRCDTYFLLISLYPLHGPHLTHGNVSNHHLHRHIFDQYRLVYMILPYHKWIQIVDS